MCTHFMHACQKPVIIRDTKERRVLLRDSFIGESSPTSSPSGFSRRDLEECMCNASFSFLLRTEANHRYACYKSKLGQMVLCKQFSWTTKTSSLSLPVRKNKYKATAEWDVASQQAGTHTLFMQTECTLELPSISSGSLAKKGGGDTNLLEYRFLTKKSPHDVHMIQKHSAALKPTVATKFTSCVGADESWLQVLATDMVVLGTPMRHPSGLEPTKDIEWGIWLKPG